MRTMSHTEKIIIEGYSLLFENLSDVCKTALMEHLLETMKTSKKKQKTENGFVLSFGKWKGPEQMTEENKAEIKDNRNFARKNVTLEKYLLYTNMCFSP
jgi:hypothetical protein